MPRVSAHTLVARAHGVDSSDRVKHPGKRGPKFVIDEEALAATLAALDEKAVAEQARRARMRAEAAVPWQTRYLR